jgi:hypothetical protein
MKIEIHPVKGTKIAEIIADDVIIKETQDALDIMANSNYQDAWKIIIYEKNIISTFFDLKSGLAGEILQKFSTYRVQLAIVGDFSKYSGKSLKDFIFESNKHGHVNFVSSFEEAKEKLIKWF